MAAEGEAIHGEVPIPEPPSEPAVTPTSAGSGELEKKPSIVAEAESTSRHSQEPSIDRRWEARAIIAAAVITAAVGAAVSIALAIMDDSRDRQLEPFAPTIAQPSNTSIFEPPRGVPEIAGSISNVAVKPGAKGLIVSGLVEPQFEAVLVTVGPRPEDPLQFWAAETALVAEDGRWRLEVETPPGLPSPYEVRAYFNKVASYVPGLVGPPPCADYSPGCMSETYGPPAIYVGNGP